MASAGQLLVWCRKAKVPAWASGLALDFDPPKPKKGLFSFGGSKSKADPLAHAGTFAFLHQTNNWPAEAICLAYALTDPSVSSVLIRASDTERLNMLALVPDRDMPPGLAAQIEMARVAGAKAA